MAIPLKPWPVDAILMIGALKGCEYREGIRGEPSPTRCHDCGAEMICCDRSVRRAESCPQRHGRPLRFICTFCFHAYDTAGVEIVDDRIKG